jgi:ubiquinone/menaquinone biosynthesis C-methylase UbiE
MDKTSIRIKKHTSSVAAYKGVSYFPVGGEINAQDQKEFESHRRVEQRRSQNTGAEVFDDLVFKASFIKTFRNFLPMLDLRDGARVLEMGAGQGWASVLVKRAYPQSYVVASDLVPSALGFSTNYEAQLGVYLDEKWAFNCRDMPFDDGQFDRIFTMAAFHHFGEHNDFGKAVAEMLRVLKPDGRIQLFYEPSTPRYLYRLLLMRANRRQAIDNVDEDVLVPSIVKSYQEKYACNISFAHYPYAFHRDNMTSTLYYYGLSKVPFLAKLLPCTVNVTITKRLPGRLHAGMTAQEEPA